jgi:two-component system chemotaxis response regulator CheB
MQPRRLQPNEPLVSTQAVVVAAEITSEILVCAFDSSVPVGGACLLPSVEPHTHRSRHEGVRDLLHALKEQGASRDCLEIKLVGSIRNSDIERQLAQFGLSAVVRKETGGTSSVVEFDCGTGALRLRAVKPKEAERPVVHPSRARKGPIRVLLVDDSPSVLLLLRKMIELDSGFEIVGEASSLKQAEELLTRNEPDVISLDLHLPDGNGADFVARYMASRPTPTVLITAFAEDDKKHVLQALDSGVFEVLGKPSVTEFAAYAQNLHATLRAATKSSSHIHKQIKKANAGIFSRNVSYSNTLLVLGASTGGTEALFTLLTALPAEVPPILVVQHIPPVFSRTFAERLDSHCAFRTKEAKEDDEVVPGRCFVAEGGKHLKLRESNGKMRISLTIDPPVNRFRPSVDYMFNTVGDLMERRSSLHVVAALLTGMGDDGADGMVRLRRLGAITIAQDEASSVVFGMPKEAIDRGGAKHISPLGEMAELIMRKLNQKRD